MLNPDAKINPKIFDKDVEKASSREGFAKGLVRAAEIDNKVVGLCADLTESTGMLSFKEKFPERFVELGVAEQNLVTVASGMASMGKIPFAASYAVFSPGRNWEQIRTTICYNNQSVKIIGSHGGLTVGADGGSHQALEDIALMRVLPRMVVISPCDAIEAEKATLAAAKTTDPTYIRLHRDKTPFITTSSSKFEIGKASIIFNNAKNDGKLDAVVIATGPILFKALLAVKSISEEGKSVALINLATIKPLDSETILQFASKAGAVVTVEDHQISGGMGSAVAEFLSNHKPVPIEFVGVRNEFGQSGTPDELLKHYKMDQKGIVDAIRKVLLKKS